MTVEEALRVLGEPEPDEVLQFHPENTRRWDEWNNRRIEALKIARSI